jgi:hypothetical protein
MRAVHQVARQCDAEGLYGTPEITLSAGGSAANSKVNAPRHSVDPIQRGRPTAHGRTRPLGTIRFEPPDIE